MARQALLIGNSAVTQAIDKSVTPSIITRTLRRFESLLVVLEANRAFTVDSLVDATPTAVRARLEAVASRCGNDLFLLYYFGHGELDANYDLQLVFPGKAKGAFRPLPLSTLEGDLRAARVARTLTILDCCYAGAGQRTFETTLNTGQHCRLSCTTATARAQVQSSSNEPPIGSFTQGVLDGFTTLDACVSATDYRVTADSLFAYAAEATQQSTNGMQEPTCIGRLDETLFEFSPQPRIQAGYNEAAGEKTTYAKLFAICDVLRRRRRYADAAELYAAVLRDYQRAFLTPFKTDEGVLEYRPARPAVLRRYVRFLRELGFVSAVDLSLSPTGHDLVEGRGAAYNRLLLEAVERYLSTHGLTRMRITSALLDILKHRGVPSKTEVFDRLAREGHRIPTNELGMTLDILGYGGVVRMTTDKAYFPWT